MDYLGAIAGLVAGGAFAPFDQTAKAQYLVQGATGGVPRVWKTIDAGIGGTVGYAAQGTKGLKEGVEGGIGAIPHIAGESITGIFSGIETLVIVGGIVALLFLTKGE